MILTVYQKLHKYLIPPTAIFLYYYFKYYYYLLPCVFCRKKCSPINSAILKCCKNRIHHSCLINNIESSGLHCPICYKYNDYTSFYFFSILRLLLKLQNKKLK